MTGYVEIKVKNGDRVIHEDNGYNTIMRSGTRSILDSFFAGAANGKIKWIDIGSDIGTGTTDNPQPITQTTLPSEFISILRHEVVDGDIVRIGVGEYKLSVSIIATDYLVDDPFILINSIRAVSSSGAVFAWRRMPIIKIGADREVTVVWTFRFGETCADVQL